MSVSQSSTFGAAPANDGVDIGSVDILSVTPGTAAANLGKAEDAAHVSGDAGVAVWAVRDDTLGVFSSTEGDYEPLHTDAQGRLYTTDVWRSPWDIEHVPLVNVQATIAQATAGVGLRNVMKTAAFVFAAGATAPTAATIEIEILDGVTVVWQLTISVPATAGAMNGVALSNLNIYGTADTSMTIRFSAAGGANTFESVAATGMVVV